MSEDDDGTTRVPTRREYVKYGGAVLGGGLLAGCAGNAGSESTPTGTGAASTAARATGTTTDAETTAETETARTDVPYDVEVEPYGTVTFEEIPETYVALGSGAWPDIGFAFGREPVAMSTSYYPLQYYEALPGVSFDVGSVIDLGDVSALDPEQFFEIGADVHVVDKQLVASYSGWDAADFERIESNVGPFAGSYIRGEWSGKALGSQFSFPYYTLPAAITLVGEVFRERARAAAWNDQLETFTREVAEAASGSSPDLGVVYSGSNPTEGTFYIASPTAAGVGNYPYRKLGASNAFAELTDEETYEIDYEGLLEMDPEYICVDSAISGIPPEEFESQFVDPMEEHPIGSELRAVKNDNVVRGCGRHQGPIVAHFETEAMAKQLYPDAFGEFDPEAWPDVPESERLFDRERISGVINGEF
ncbi:ABC transporter substrate-binding protein [Halobium palmae]|uniref:ABC transporter substrate-binding protein n=1 Tax=Halobium palmae TaxID=1776492 RepID=A0ABD5S117_9EURY